MKAIQTLFSEQLIEAFGWTLLHSIWQISIVAISVTLILLLLRKNSAQARYFIAFSSLIIIAIWTSVTFNNALKYANEKQALKIEMTSNPNYLKSLIHNKFNITITDSEKTFDMRMIKIRSFFQRNFDIICSIWLLGMVILMIRLLGGLFYTHRLRTTQLEPITGEWLNIIEETIIKLRVTIPLEASFSKIARSPMTLGIIKPILLFPASSITGLSTKQIESIVAHEIAHVIRHDYLFNILQSIVEIVFFYHPAIWLISTHIRGERENCCDDIAVEITEDRVAYVKALASIQLNSAQSPKMAMNFSKNGHSLLNRIKRIQNQDTMKTNFLEGVIATGVIIIGLSLASFTNSTSSFSTNRVSLDIETTNEVKVLNSTQKDSIRHELAEKVEKAKVDNKDTKELTKAVEVALSETNPDESDKLIIEINNALTEVNINDIIRETILEVSNAMKEVSAEIKIAKQELKNKQINTDMSEAAADILQSKKEMERDMRRDMTKDGVDKEIIEASIKAASAGMDIAASVVGNLDLENIISTALDGVSIALSTNNDEEDTTETTENEKKVEKHLKKIKSEKRELLKEQEKLQKKLEKLEHEEQKLTE